MKSLFDERTYAFFPGPVICNGKEKLCRTIMCTMAKGPDTYTGDTMEQVTFCIEYNRGSILNHGDRLVQLNAWIKQTYSP